MLQDGKYGEEGGEYIKGEITDTTVAGRKKWGGRGYSKEGITSDTTVTGYENGGEDRRARRDEVLIEFPTTQNAIHLTHCTHNLTLSQA